MPRRRRLRRRASPAAAAALLLAIPVVLAIPVDVSARDWPAARGHLNDFAGVVDRASADSIEALARELREKTGAQLAVVTVEDLGGETIDPVAEELFRQWGIGGKGRDDGALILLARRERRVRIEVGYGLEGILPDGRCGAIIRQVMGPDLRADRFGPGLLRGAEAVARVIAEDRGVALRLGGSNEPPPLETRRGSSVAGIIGLIFFFIFVAVVVGAILSSLRRARGDRGWGDWRTRRRRGWYDPWGGFGGGLGGLGGFGGFGGGGGGGGFGGFGGGRSGGGGASGGF